VVAGVDHDTLVLTPRGAAAVAAAVVACAG
jgi:hypothetical protein